MTFDIPQTAMQIGAQIIGSLKSDSQRVKAVAVSEGRHLAYALARIAELLGTGHISPEEAAMLTKVQRDASEVTLASLAEISRISAHRAVGNGLKAIVSLVDHAIGMPMVSAALKL